MPCCALADSVDEDLEDALTAEELRQLILAKYGKTHDVSIVRRDFPGLRTYISLNVMWPYLGEFGPLAAGACHACSYRPYDLQSSGASR